MSKWIDTDLLSRQLMIRRIADERHFADSAAEKDWWVMMGRTELCRRLNAAVGSNVVEQILFY